MVGTGATGQVYLARDTILGRRVALKLLNTDISDPLARKLWLEEARLTARLNHPHVVTIHAVGIFGDRPYLALEYLDAESLRSRISEGPLKAKQRCALGLHSLRDSLKRIEQA